MHQKQLALVAIGVVALAGTTSLALFYRGQATHYRQEWQTALAQPQPAPEAGAAPAAAVRVQTVRIPESTGDGAEEIARLNVRIRDLEEQLAARPAAPAQTVAPDAPRGPAADAGPRRRTDWMSALRTNDPTRYAEFQQRRAAAQQAVQDAWNQKTNYFLNRDTSRMSEEELQEYNQMLSVLTQTWELSQRMQVQSGMSHDERHQVIDTVRSNITVLVPLLNNERDREFYDLAVGMGHSANDAAAFALYANQIIDATSLRNLIPGGGRGMGFGGGPGGGGFAPGFGNPPGGGGGGAPASR